MNTDPSLEAELTNLYIICKENHERWLSIQANLCPLATLCKHSEYNNQFTDSLNEEKQEDPVIERGEIPISRKILEDIQRYISVLLRVWFFLFLLGVDITYYLYALVFYVLAICITDLVHRISIIRYLLYGVRREDEIPSDNGIRLKKYSRRFTSLDDALVKLGSSTSKHLKRDELELMRIEDEHNSFYYHTRGKKASCLLTTRKFVSRNNTILGLWRWFYQLFIVFFLSLLPFWVPDARFVV